MGGVSYLNKRETLYIGAHPHLPNFTKECQQIILHAVLHEPVRGMPVEAHTCTYVPKWACSRKDHEAQCGAQAS
jgi:hypothetical protein